MAKRFSLSLLYEFFAVPAPSFFALSFSFFVCFCSCSVQKRTNKVITTSFIDSAAQALINNAELITAHVGVCVYDVSAKKYFYSYQSDKYFIPASNTKIMTCYAAMKCLGDSIVGLRYDSDGDTIKISPTGDPTFLSVDFKNQPVWEFLERQNKVVALTSANWKEQALGAGWSWDDYNDDYMAERSAFPIYANLSTWKKPVVMLHPPGFSLNVEEVIPKIFRDSLQEIMVPEIADTVLKKNEQAPAWLWIRRNQAENKFSVYFSNKKSDEIFVPFAVRSFDIISKILADTLGIKINITDKEFAVSGMQPMYSQPTDSLLKIMMHRSDNFFAEQSLLMVSNEKLGIMNDEKIIDTLLKTDLKEMPQKPQWVDGSGLSRFNLFSPQDLVFVLDKMRNEFSWQRITSIFATGGSGTLANRFKNLSGKIFAKTGTLSNNIALSGYLIATSGKPFIFSVLVGNHMGNGGSIRDAIENFITGIYNHY